MTNPKKPTRTGRQKNRAPGVAQGIGSLTLSQAITLRLPRLHEALQLCEDAQSAIPRRPGAGVADTFVKAFFFKATRTLKAICLLYAQGLSEEAQSLVRILFELQVTFSTFVVMLGRDPDDACRRLLDAVALEKVKQQRACGFKWLHLVPGTPTREEHERTEREIRARYSEQDFAALRKNGFSGQSLEGRCATLDERSGGTEYTDTYNIIYRNFSRNVHSTDLTEALMCVDPTAITPRAIDLVESRDHVSCDLVLSIAHEMVRVINREFKLGLRSRLDALRIEESPAHTT